MSKKFVDSDNVGLIKQKVEAGLATKQDALVSGMNLRTINQQSLLGGGDIQITSKLYLGEGQNEDGGMTQKATTDSLSSLKATVEALQKKVDNLSSGTFPVGSIFTTVSHTTPEEVASALGGTWERWGEGRFVMSWSNASSDANPVEREGGSNSHNHTVTANWTDDSNPQATGGPSVTSTGSASGNTGATTLTINQIPSHYHDLRWGSSTGQGVCMTVSNTGGTVYDISTTWYSAKNKANDLGGYSNLFTSNIGGGGSHTHTLNSHTHSLQDHTHSIPAHNHRMPAFNTQTTLTFPEYIVAYMYKRIA